MSKNGSHDRNLLIAVAALVALLGVGGQQPVQAQRAPQRMEGKTAPREEQKVSIVEHIRRIQQFVKKQEEVVKGKRWNYTSPSEKELARKLTRARSPMIVFQGWSGSTSPGGSITYTVGIYNPDPTTQFSLYAHVFVGPANPVSNTGLALGEVDPRFPRLTMPDFFGLSIASGATETLQFTIGVPSNIEKSNYLGNAFLFRASYHDVGLYLDRGVFPFEVN